MSLSHFSLSRFGLALALLIIPAAAQAEQPVSALLSQSIALAPANVTKQALAANRELLADKLSLHRNRLAAARPTVIPSALPRRAVGSAFDRPRSAVVDAATRGQPADLQVKRLAKLTVSREGSGALDLTGDGLLSFGIPDHWIGKHPKESGGATVAIDDQQYDSVVDHVLGIPPSAVANTAMIIDGQIAIISRSRPDRPRAMRNFDFDNSTFESAFGNEELW